MMLKESLAIKDIITVCQLKDDKNDLCGLNQGRHIENVNLRNQYGKNKGFQWHN